MLIKTQKQQQQAQAKQKRHATRAALASTARLLPKHRDQLTDTEFSDIVSSVVFKQ